METPGLSPLHTENVPASGPWPGHSGPRPRVSNGHGGGLEAGNGCGNEVSDARKGPSFPMTGKAFPDVTPPNLCPAWVRMWGWGALPRRYYPGTSSSLSKVKAYPDLSPNTYRTHCAPAHPSVLLWRGEVTLPLSAGPGTSGAEVETGLRTCQAGSTSATHTHTCAPLGPTQVLGLSPCSLVGTGSQ